MNFGYIAVGLRSTWIEYADFKQLFCKIFLRVLRDPARLRVANDGGRRRDYFYSWKGSSDSVEKWNKQKCAVKSAPGATSWTSRVDVHVVQYKCTGELRIDHQAN